MRLLQSTLLCISVICGLLLIFPHVEPHLRFASKSAKLKIQLDQLIISSEHSLTAFPTQLFLVALSEIYLFETASIREDINYLNWSRTRTTSFKSNKKSESIYEWIFSTKLSDETKILKLRNESEQKDIQLQAADKQFSLLSTALKGKRFYNFRNYKAAAVATNLVTAKDLENIIANCAKYLPHTPVCSRLIHLAHSKFSISVEDKIGKGKFLYNRPLEIWRGEEVTIEAVISPDQSIEPTLRITSALKKSSQEILTFYKMSLLLRSSEHLKIIPKGLRKKIVKGSVETRFIWRVRGMKQTQNAKLLLSMYEHKDASGDPAPTSTQFSDIVKVKVSNWMNVSDVLSNLGKFWFAISGVFALFGWLAVGGFSNLAARLNMNSNNFSAPTRKRSPRIIPANRKRVSPK